MSSSIDTSDTGDPGDSGEHASELFGHTGALRRLARGMLFDPGRAEDVVQRTWIEAMRQDRLGASRAWLVGVARNLARETRREEARRAARERRAARPEALPSALDALERLEVLRRVVAAVQELDEPYRSTILMRFFDDLPPRVIARRQGVPVNTVRTRVQRGLAQLRRQLDDEGGGASGRGALLAALLPIAGPLPLPLGLGLSWKTSTILKWSGAVSTTSKVPLIAAGAILCALSILTWHGLRGGAAEAQRGPLESQAAELASAASAPGEQRQPALMTPAVSYPGAASARTAAPAAKSWVLRGRVLRGRSDPFAGVAIETRLWASYEAAGEPAATADLTSDSEGRFAWALPEPSTAVTVELRAARPNHVSGSDERLIVAGEPAPQDLELRLYPLDFTIAGVVRDPVGQPVPEAAVRAIAAEVRTDGEGRYRLAAPSLYRRVYVHADAAALAQASGVVQTAGPGVEVALDLVLGAELRVAGNVLDETGRAIPGATVGAHIGGQLETTSDADGRYVLEHLERTESTQYLYAAAEGFVMGRGELEGGEREEAALDFVLERGVRLEGRVVAAEDGRPIPGARLTVGFSPWDFEGVHAVSRDAGEFAIEPVGRKSDLLWVRREGWADARIELEIPAAGALVAGLEVALERGHFAGGIVVDDRGAPREGVKVAARLADEYLEGSVSTDEEGRFRLEGLPQGSVALELYGDGIVRLEHPLAELDRDDLQIAIERAGGLAGRVVDGATGEPLRSFAIRFVDPLLEEGEERLVGYGSDWHEGLALERSDGVWDTRGENLQPGRLIGIEATAPGYAPALAERAVVAADPDPEGLVLALFPGASVTGRVVAAESGAPIADALVLRTTPVHPLQSWRPDDTEGRIWARTGADGRFELRQVPAGEMTLAVLHADWTRAFDGPFEVPLGGGVSPRWIELRPGGRITGRLFSAGGEPLAGELVILSSVEPAIGPRGDSREMTTDRDGRFAFAHLGDGIWQVSQGIQRGHTTVYDLSTGVRIEGGGDEELQLRPRGTGTIHGTLRTAGELPEYVTVYARLLRPASAAGSESADAADSIGGWRAGFAERGRFTLEGLEPGEWRVSASYGGRRGSASIHGDARTELAEGGTADVWIELAARD